MKYVHVFIFFPLTVLLRVALMTAPLVIYAAGKVALAAFDWLNENLPGYRRVPSLRSDDVRFNRALAKWMKQQEDAQ